MSLVKAAKHVCKFLGFEPSSGMKVNAQGVCHCLSVFKVVWQRVWVSVFVFCWVCVVL